MSLILLALSGLTLGMEIGKSDSHPGTIGLLLLLTVLLAANHYLREE